MNWAEATRCRAAVAWGLATTVVVEGATLWLRFASGRTAADFNATAPLLLQIHHMFWSIPLFLVAAICWRFQRTSGAILGIAGGLVLSELIHHYIVLPATVGNTAWHWPEALDSRAILAVSARLFDAPPFPRPYCPAFIFVPGMIWSANGRVSGITRTGVVNFSGNPSTR